MSGKNRRLLAAGVAAAGAALAGKAYSRVKKKEAQRLLALEEAVLNHRDYGEDRAYIVGGGLSSMAAAAYLIRDCCFPGSQITVFEETDRLGGRGEGGCLLAEGLYENFWELFGGIPSLKTPGRSVRAEIFGFNQAHPVLPGGRLIDRRGKWVDTDRWDLNVGDQKRLLALLAASEKELDSLSIQDWFAREPHFFATDFWKMWQTSFLFQRWSSAGELRRWLRRLMPDLKGLGSGEHLIRLPYSVYESLILPLETWLVQQGVCFQTGCRVMDLEFSKEPGITVEGMLVRCKTEDGFRQRWIALKGGDICIMSTSSMSGEKILGDLDHPIPTAPEMIRPDRLWIKAAGRQPGLGNPEPFFSRSCETERLTFTVTCRGDGLLEALETFSHTRRGKSGLITLTDSSWLLTTIVPVQPCRADQKPGELIFQGYGVNLQTPGDFVKKTMKECSGREILREYLLHLGLSEERIQELLETVVEMRLCLQPYGGAYLQPRSPGDRAPVVPTGSGNFAVIGQFAELPEEISFTGEYSIRTARTAVYTLMDLSRPLIPVPACTASRYLSFAARLFR